VNHTLFPKEDHLPDWARPDNKVTNGDRVDNFRAETTFLFFQRKNGDRVSIFLRNLKMYEIARIFCLQKSSSLLKRFHDFVIATIHLKSGHDRFLPHYLYFLTTDQETAVSQWLRRCATNRKVAGSIPAGISGLLIDIKSFRSHYGPGVVSATKRTDYQDYFLGVKVAGA